MSRALRVCAKINQMHARNTRGGSPKSLSRLCHRISIPKIISFTNSCAFCGCLVSTFSYSTSPEISKWRSTAIYQWRTTAARRTTSRCWKELITTRHDMETFSNDDIQSFRSLDLDGANKKRRTIDPPPSFPRLEGQGEFPAGNPAFPVASSPRGNPSSGTP